ncbi:hypothetical protein [Herbidospora galbida]|nr:hypothetical protein [Herbidospora galbida]
MSQNLDLAAEVMSAYSDMVDDRSVDYVIYKIDDDGSTIVPEKSGDGYDDFLASLPADECRWGLCEMDLGSYGALCSFEPVFFTWLPPAAPEAQRALYERSSGLLSQEFDVVVVSTTVSGPAEASHEALVNRLAAAGHPRHLELPDHDISIGRFAGKAQELLFELRSNDENERDTYGHVIFKLNRLFMHDVAQTGDLAVAHDEFLAGLPADECRWVLYTLDISSLTSEHEPTYTFFFTWIPRVAPERNRNLFYLGGDGTAMGAYETRFTPTGMLADKVEEIAECFMGDVSGLSEVSYERLWEMARRRFKRAEAEKQEDEEADRRLRQEDAIIQGEVAEGGLYR